MNSRNFSIRPAQHELKLFQQRLFILVIFVIFLSLALIIRLIYLQVIQHETYVTLAKQNQLGLIPVEPQRGLIYDRSGNIIANNNFVFSLDIIPAKAKPLNKTIERLSHIISINSNDIDSFYNNLAGKKKFQPIPIKFNLSEKEIAKVYVNQWQFPGVVVTSRFMRNYPNSGALVSILGFMARISEKEAKNLDPVNYSATSEIGQLGVEKHFEELLHGEVGYQQVETDAAGRIVRILKRVEPVSGSSIYLTIDLALQKAAQEGFGNQPGAAVAIQPSTGEVLALYSNPTYDPNAFVQGISSKDYRALQHAAGRPLYNRAIRGLYAPGSTAKPYMVLEGLSQQVVSPDYAISDPGFFIYGHHTYKDWQKQGHGVVNAQKAITVSCDTYFFNLAVKMGIQRIIDILTNFGFGKPTGIEEDEELGGLLPSPAWKKKVHHHPWYTGDTIVTGIGQGYLLVTPLQMAQGVATIANQGKLMQTHLLLKIVTPTGEVIKTQPKILSNIDLPNSVWKIVRNGMIGVIQEPWGTGFRFGRNPPYSVAAKTGTVQVFHSNQRYKESEVPEHLRDHSTFIAYAPVEHPQIAVAVVAEHSELAASIARRMIDTYLITEKHLKNNNK